MEDKAVARAPMVELVQIHTEMAEGVVLVEEQLVALVLECIQLVALEVQLVSRLLQSVNLLVLACWEVALAAPVHFQEGIVKRLELEAVQKGQEVSPEALVQKDLVVYLGAQMVLLVQMGLEVLLAALDQLLVQEDPEVSLSLAWLYLKALLALEEPKVLEVFLEALSAGQKILPQLLRQLVRLLVMVEVC